jgi:hypothetical protein
LGISLVVIAVIVAVGIPLLVIPFVRKGAKDDLKRPQRCLHWGFWLTNASFAVAMALENFFPASEPRAVSIGLLANVVLIAFCASAWSYWASLAVLAQRTGRSAAIWVAAGLATLAIGFFVTYILMIRRVRAALKTKTV